MRGLLIVFVVFFNCILFGQGRLGDALFDNFEYKQAIEYYNNDSNLSLNQKENLAYCYYVTQDFLNAEEIYREIVASEEKYPVFYQLYAICLRNNGKYDQAKVYFEKVLAADSSFIESKIALEGLENHKIITSKEEQLEVMNVSGLNSSAASYSPVWYKNGVLFCAEDVRDSLKRRPKIDVSDDFDQHDQLAYGLVERPLSSIFYAELVGAEVKKVEPFLSSTKFHIGNFALNKNQDKLIFTKVDLNRQWDPNARNFPRLFTTSLSGVIQTDEAERIIIKKFSKEYASGHPVLSGDEKTMYFSSDMPGGYGGSDLYVTTLGDDGKWSEAKNLGPQINTAGDELNPYLYNDEYLYFASNGHLGFGGLDVLKIAISDIQNAKPELLDAPINSVSDDFGILIDPSDPNIGFITSNRLGGLGDDDIYAFRLKLDGFFVQGIVKDLEGNPVANALIKIYDENGNEIAQTKTDENGKYILELEEEGNYSVIATVPGYGDKELVSIDEDWDNQKVLEMILEPTNTAQGTVKNEDGSVVANAQIALADEEGNVIFKGLTDEDGYYQFPLFEDNKKYVATATDGTKRGSETFTTDENYNSLEDKDIVLTNSGTFVEGVVLDKDGNPAVGVEVKLFDADGNLIATTITDENGNYHFDLEKDKDYQILAVTDGFEALQNIYTGDKYDASNKLNLQLEPVGKESFALVEDNESKKGLEGVVVTLVDNETGNKLTTKTDAEGKFIISVKPNHSYTINLNKDGYYPRSVRIEAGKKLPEKVDLNQMGDFGMDYAGYNVEKIFFELDSYQITKESRKQVDKLIEVLKANHRATVTIKSYADCRGPKKYNISLSFKRSLAVKNYLIENGIKENRILTESLGATNFVNNCTTDEACTEMEHSLNRRSEFEIDFKK